jgi:hypothetical protein
MRPTYRGLGREAVEEPLSYVAPAGEEQSLVERALAVTEGSVDTSFSNQLTAA